MINNSLSSARLHERSLGYSNDRWAILPNGFELEKFVPSERARQDLRAELRLPPDSLLIGLIGRYHPMKDHSNFLKAAGILGRRDPSVHFVLAGAGVDSANVELRELAKAFGVADCLHLLGARTDAPYITAALDIAGSASYSEAFPNVIGEAMSCGVPCVVTDVGDSAWLVGDTGFFVTPRDSNALADAWTELINRGEQGRQTLGTAARSRIAGMFSIASVAAQYARLYDQVLKRHGARKTAARCPPRSAISLFREVEFCHEDRSSTHQTRRRRPSHPIRHADPRDDQDGQSVHTSHRQPRPSGSRHVLSTSPE